MYGISGSVCDTLLRGGQMVCENHADSRGIETATAKLARKSTVVLKNGAICYRAGQLCALDSHQSTLANEFTTQEDVQNQQAGWDMGKQGKQ